jgi:hypothetical protein
MAAGPDVPIRPEPPRRKGVSPARHLVGLIVLGVVGVAGFVEVRNMLGFNEAVRQLDKHLGNENEELLLRPDAEKLIGIAPDGPPEPAGNEDKVTYTWHGLIKQHRLTAYYTRVGKPALLRIEGS